MRVGGPARFFVEARDEATVVEAVEWAAGRGLAVHVLGGGSNLVVADEGIGGLVIKISCRGIDTEDAGAAVLVTAAAGEPWDDLVRRTVECGWAGLECLSGIPGRVGATPIQNVGAYGQEVSETVAAVRVLDRERRAVITLAPGACRFAYRDSIFKSGSPGRHIVLSVAYRLVPGGPPALRYAELERHLAARAIARPSLADVRGSVLDLRRAKAMLIEGEGPDSRSCGSFFLNPIVDAAEWMRLEQRPGVGGALPCWPQPGGTVKLSAAWLIEHAGLARGARRGPVGLSSRHALAIVCHEGARARDVIELAREVRRRVEQCFGVRLDPEPVFWGPLGLDEGVARLPFASPSV
jgi:UDP-N-acetylmuramate dehydrogenase